MITLSTSKCILGVALILCIKVSARNNGFLMAKKTILGLVDLSSFTVCISESYMHKNLYNLSNQKGRLHIVKKMNPFPNLLSLARHVAEKKRLIFFSFLGKNM